MTYFARQNICSAIHVLAVVIKYTIVRFRLTSRFRTLVSLCLEHLGAAVRLVLVGRFFIDDLRSDQKRELDSKSSSFTKIDWGN